MKSSIKQPENLSTSCGLSYSYLNSVGTTVFDRAKIDCALRAEAETGYIVPSGRYWEVADQFDTQLIDRIDQLWLNIASEQKSQPEIA
jgi:hypothetical protein